jgi:hypothetical protein
VNRRKLKMNAAFSAGSVTSCAVAGTRDIIRRMAREARARDGDRSVRIPIQSAAAPERDSRRGAGWFVMGRVTVSIERTVG